MLHNTNPDFFFERYFLPSSPPTATAYQAMASKATEHSAETLAAISTTGLTAWHTHSVALFTKRKSLVPISKASERPSDYHPSCGLTSGSSIADNDKLAQKSAAG